MANLPKEVVQHMLTFLDLETLLACCHVNRVWNEASNSLCSKTWLRACRKAGIYVKENRYKAAKDWKALISSTRKRVRDVGDTSVIAYEFDKPITAMYCHNDKVAVAFSGRIELWNLPDNQLVVALECNFEPLHLEFDDNILSAASRSGVLSCYSLTSVKDLWCFSCDDGILTDFDYLASHDIVVGSFDKKDIRSFICRLWNSANSQVHNIEYAKYSTVEKVLLVPHPDHPVSEQEKTCFLFCLAKYYVIRTRVRLYNGIIESHEEAWLAVLPVPDRLSITERVESDKSPGGLHFDGKTLYISSSTRTACSHTIWAWNWRTNSKWCIENPYPIIILLGVGEKYLVFETRQGDGRELVTAVDKDTKKTISQFLVPRRTRLNRDDYLCLGNTSWLDGINGQNNHGVVYASVTDDRLGVYVRRFAPPS